MAIITDVPYGDEFKADQYLRVEEVIIKNKNIMEITVNAYEDSDEAKSNVPSYYGHTFETDYDLYDSDNAWQQAYEKVKVIFTPYTDV